jgi:hypothetical protein
MNPPGIFNHFLGYRFLTIEIALCYFYIALFIDNGKINIVLLVSFHSFGREMSSRESTFFYSLLFETIYDIVDVC